MQVDIESDDDEEEGFQVVAKEEHVEGGDVNQPESPILILSDSEEDDIVELPVVNETTTFSDPTDSQKHDNSSLVGFRFRPPAGLLHAPTTMMEEPRSGVDEAIKRVVLGDGGEGHGTEQQVELLNISKESQVHWRFTKKDFIECPVCSWRSPTQVKPTQVKICNIANHFMKVHNSQLDLVNQERGCQGCGAENVPVQFLENHQDCSIKKSKGANCVNDNETRQSVGARLIKLTFISQLNGAEEIMVKRRKYIEGEWVKRNVGKNKKMKVHRSNLLFLYKGKELDILATPMSLGMQNGDVVTVKLRDEDTDITIKFVSSDATFIKRVKKTTTMKEIKKDLCKRMGVTLSEIKLCFNDVKVGLKDTPSLLLMRQNDVIHVWKFLEEPTFPYVKKRKACEDPDEVTDPKVSKLIQDASNDPTIIKPIISLSTDAYIGEERAAMNTKELKLAALYYTEEQRAAVVKEVVEDHYSPVDLGKKYKISARKIRDWVRIAGHRPPDSYGKETQNSSATEGGRCVTLSSSEEEEESMEKNVTECETNGTQMSEYIEDVEEFKHGNVEKIGGNQRSYQIPRWPSRSSASAPPIASTSRSSRGSSMGLQALASASAELEDQQSKPSLDVLGDWVLDPKSLYRVMCPECGYVPAPTLGALYQHMLQHHPKVSGPPRTCYKCRTKVSPIDVETHFQTLPHYYGNHLFKSKKEQTRKKAKAKKSKKISKSINPDTYPASVLSYSSPRALLPQHVPWHGPRVYRPSSDTQVYRPPPGPHLYRPPSGPPQGHTWPPNTPLRHSYGPPAPWPGEWNQPPPGYWSRQPPGPRWRY